MIAPEPFLLPRGTPISVLQRLAALSQLGHKVDLATYHVGEPVVLPGVTIRRIPNLRLIRSVKPGPSWTKAFLDILLFIKVLFMLLRKRYDVIHSHEEASYFAAPLAKVFRLRHLYDMHSSLPQQLGSYHFVQNRWLVQLFEKLERIVFHSCDALITIGDDLQQCARSINPEINVITIENLPVQVFADQLPVVDIERVKAGLGLNGSPTVLYTGTFEPYQGLDLLIGSAKRVVKNFPDVVFVLVGGSPDQVKYWRRVADQSALGESIRFTGIVPIDEIPNILEVASILVSPRLSGMSIPLKLYTYLLSGKPLVATRTFGHLQVLNEEMAVLTAPEEEAFANGIVRLLEYPQLGHQIGRCARLFAQQQYQAESYLNKLNHIYKTLE
jgi:glycosyltransferase involved in cell wall biosynthesis